MATQTIKKQEEVSGMRPSDRWIPWYFVAFFVVLFCVNGVFIYMAESTHTGVVTKHAYDEGIHYNETIKHAEDAQQLAWSFSVTRAEEGDILVRLSDKSGVALDGVTIKASAFRPAQAGYDFDFTLEGKGAGIYEGTPDFPLEGLWEVRFFLDKGDEHNQFSKRFVIKK